MKTALRAAALTLVLAASSAPAIAQSSTLQFTNSGSVTWNGVYVGPYEGKVLSEPGQPTIDLFCVDYQHTIASNQIWNATFSNVMGDLSATRAGQLYGEAIARTMYQKAAFLTTMYASAPTSQYAAINSAIWNIFDSSSPDKSGSGMNSSSYWLTYAGDNYLTSGIDYSGFAVVTDVKVKGGKGGVQEFLTTTVTATPEPSTYLLMASGLAGLAGLSHRRRRARQG